MSNDKYSKLSSKERLKRAIITLPLPLLLLLVPADQEYRGMTRDHLLVIGMIVLFGVLIKEYIDYRKDKTKST